MVANHKQTTANEEAALIISIIFCPFLSLTGSVFIIIIFKWRDNYLIYVNHTSHKCTIKLVANNQGNKVAHKYNQPATVKIPGKPPSPGDYHYTQRVQCRVNTYIDGSSSNAVAKKELIEFKLPRIWWKASLPRSIVEEPQ